MDEFASVPEPPRDVEFRDGIFQVPAYLADIMAALPTHTMTKEEAIGRVNGILEQRVISQAYDGIIKRHFEGPR